MAKKIKWESLAEDTQVPYDPAEQKRLEKEKRDKIDKGDFTFLKATYEMEILL